MSEKTKASLTPEAIKELRQQAQTASAAAYAEVMKKVTAPYDNKIKTLTDKRQALLDELDKVDAEIAELASEVKRIRGEPEINSKKPRAAKTDGTRTRRDTTALETDATEMVKVLKAAGTAGASSADLIAAAKPKLGMKLMDFIQQYGKVKVAKIGSVGATVRYKLA